MSPFRTGETTLLHGLILFISKTPTADDELAEKIVWQLIEEFRPDAKFQVIPLQDGDITNLVDIRTLPCLSSGGDTFRQGIEAIKRFDSIERRLHA